MYAHSDAIANITVAMMNSTTGPFSPNAGSTIGARKIMPPSCEPVTAMLKTLFAAIS